MSIDILEVMAALLFLLLLIWGYQMTYLLPIAWYRPERVAMGTVLGLFGGSWLLLLFSLVVPYSLGIPLTVLIVVITGGWLRWYGRKTTSKELYIEGSRQTVVWLIATLVISCFLVYVFYTHMFQVGSDGWYSAGSSWADLAMHGSLITYFAAHDRFSFTMSLFYGGKLTYPFLIDFLSGVLYRLGWSIQSALIFPGLLLMLSLVQLFFFLSYRLFKSMSAAVLGLLIFLMNGSFAGISYFWSDWRGSGLGLLDFFRSTTNDYAHLPEHDLHMYNVLFGALLPQRGVLFGFTILLIVLTLVVGGRKESLVVQNQLAVVGGILVGLLPFAHVHSFFVAMGVLGWLAIALSISSRKLYNPLWLSLGIAAVLAAPQLWWQVSSSYHQGFGFWHFGWMKPEGQNVVTFWLRNIGLMFLFLVGNIFLIWKYCKDRLYLHLYLPFFLVFLAVNAYVFQPNIWDNTKFYYYSYLIVSLFTGYFLVCAATTWFRTLVVATVGATILSTGVLAMGHELSHSYQFLSNDDIAFAAKVKELTPADAVILVADQHNHPVSVLSGRQILLGYRGWLWSYGIDYASVEQDESYMFAGGAESDHQIQKYGVSYIVIGEPELMTWHANAAYLMYRYPTVYQTGTWRLLKVN